GQCCWRTGVLETRAHLLLQVRTRVLHREWEKVSRGGYPSFRQRQPPRVGTRHRKLSFPPHGLPTTSLRLFYSPSRSKISQIAKKRLESQASSSSGHSGRSLKVKPET